ncbi:MAG TPA: glucoamylase family protein, partial [Thermoanaerobaculia bacterium]|nr:glucoamylase family protein [Thermoanaerobaculia bacterium]
NSRRATLAHRAYATANPMGWEGYGANVWGLTACDGPMDATLTIRGRTRTFHSYWPRGASLTYVNDDGTIAPAAAAGSVPFAPEISIPALREMTRRWADNLCNQYGFLDAFNPTLRDTRVAPKHGKIVPGVGWFDIDQLGIDQGPIVTMIENYRSELVWRTMRRNPYIIAGLKRAGFTGGWLDRPAR